MQRVAPGAEFETYAGGLEPGLEDVVGVRLRDGAGDDAVERTTDGVVEDIPDSGIYRASLTAPDTAGEYWVVFDDETTFAAPQLVVVIASAGGLTLPSGRDLCTLDDIDARVPGYTIGDDEDTDDTLARLITEESHDWMEECGREITARTPNPAARLFDLDAFDVEERLVEIGDAAEVTLVEILDDTEVLAELEDGDWTAIPRESRREPWQPITELRLAAAAPIAPGRVVRVTATWGFPSIPDTVRRGVASLVLWRYLNDVAAGGTQLADALDREELNLGAARGAALDARKRLRVPVIG